MAQLYFKINMMSVLTLICSISDPLQTVWPKERPLITRVPYWLSDATGSVWFQELLLLNVHRVPPYYYHSALTLTIPDPPVNICSFRFQNMLLNKAIKSMSLPHLLSMLGVALHAASRRPQCCIQSCEPHSSSLTDADTHKWNWKKLLQVVLITVNSDLYSFVFLAECQLIKSNK